MSAPSSPGGGGELVGRPHTDPRRSFLPTQCTGMGWRSAPLGTQPPNLYYAQKAGLFV